MITDPFVQGFLYELGKEAGLKTLGLIAAMAAAPAAGVGTHLLTRPDLHESRVSAIHGGTIDLIHKQLSSDPLAMARHLRHGGAQLPELKRMSESAMTLSENLKHPGVAPAKMRINNFLGKIKESLPSVHFVP